MHPSMLSADQARLLQDEKEVLSTLMIRLAAVNAPRESLAQLQKAVVQLDELFLIVVVGEFNAGKSALVNAILGEKILSEGVTPTTTRVTLLKWGEEVVEQIVDENFSIFTYPLPLLQELNIVDSPGTNAIIRHHERLTDEFVPRSDLVLFVTSAERPMTESETQFLKRILTWGKKVVFVLNKADIFEDKSALEEVRAYIVKHAAALLGDMPVLFPVSARLAERAQAEPDDEKRRQCRLDSNLDELEKYITSTLDDSQKLRLKLANPLGVASNVILQMENALQLQEEDLREDRETVDALEATISGYEQELKSELTPRLAEIETVLQRLEMRGLDFFDSTIRLTNIKNLMHGDRIRKLFEKQVLGDVSQEIDDMVRRLIDWLVDKDLREWQQVMAYLQRRQSLNLEHIVTAGGSPQANRRRELIETVGKSSKTIVESYDRTREASSLAANVENAVAQTALLEAGAVGLGTLVTTAVLSTALDVTGLIAAGTLAIVGFFVIPFKRKQARDTFREKMTVMRSNLIDTLTETFFRESGNAVDRLKDNVTPYTRFVETEWERINKTRSTLEELKQNLSTLRARIDSVTRQPG